MKYLSICSGIEAASKAWEHLGWHPVAFAEIDAFPNAFLAHKYPHVPNLGDLAAYRTWPRELLAEIDIIVGGTPCQAFSFAGLRESLDDERGNLTLILVHLLDYVTEIRHSLGRPAPILVWENVPGVLTTGDNAYGCFLGGLAGEDGPLQPAGEKWTYAGCVFGPVRAIAWRTLDCQYFGLAQRRPRVFVIASAGTAGIDPRKVLFESEGVRRDSPPSREPGEKVTGTFTARTRGGGTLGTDFELDGGLVPERLAFGGNNTSGAIDVAACLAVNNGASRCGDFEAGTLLLEPFAFKASHFTRDKDGAPSPITPPLTADADKGDQDILIAAPEPFTFDAAQITHPENRSEIGPHKPSSSLSKTSQMHAVVFNMRGRDGENMPEVDPDGLAVQRAASGGCTRSFVATDSHAGYAVRRLTPRECERLQGFPDDHTLVPYGNTLAKDSPRYKAIGNSMPVDVMRWLGGRIADYIWNHS